MKQVIRQIKERSMIVLESKGIKYHMWRIDDLEDNKLRDNSLRIEDPDFWFYHSLFRSQHGKEDELNLAEFFVVLESIFGESSDYFDKWKGSFSFPLLLVVEKKTGSFFYLMQISDHRGSVYFRLNKIVENGVEDNENNKVYKPFEEEFSRIEINYFLSYFYGYLIGYFEVFKRITLTQPFLNRIDSNLIFYGYKDNDYFEEDCYTPEEYQAGIQSFEGKYSKVLKQKNVNTLLQNIMNKSVEIT
ncbi:hypothetical protein WA1_20485 [Scytonema hofmannii PCC 7110]|uniref:Uncharacterized protein n=1 Tax=Scytonema hofmannii PCC 7110 TaxID=128403 RepID=A0A139XCC8_9CYAN|nr:hypothetical protein [Scytonema hofmannii]KYC42350.1 hypothetical protein WA1_20485 [Scytonema hofmannii PCC 7110]